MLIFSVHFNFILWFWLFFGISFFSLSLISSVVLFYCMLIATLLFVYSIFNLIIHHNRFFFLSEFTQQSHVCYFDLMDCFLILWLFHTLVLYFLVRMETDFLRHVPRKGIAWQESMHSFEYTRWYQVC